MAIKPLEIRKDLLHLLDGLLQATRQGVPLPDSLFDLSGIHSNKHVGFGTTDVFEVLSK